MMKRKETARDRDPRTREGNSQGSGPKNAVKTRARDRDPRTVKEKKRAGFPTDRETRSQSECADVPGDVKTHPQSENVGVPGVNPEVQDGYACAVMDLKVPAEQQW